MGERDEGNTSLLFPGHVSKLKFLDVTFMPKTYVYNFFMHNYFSKVLGYYGTQFTDASVISKRVIYLKHYSKVLMVLQCTDVNVISTKLMLPVMNKHKCTSLNFLGCNGH